MLTQPGVRLVSLQYGDCAAELAAIREGLGVDVQLDDDVDPLRDMDAFAAQVAAMDLVVSVDNTTVHTAGALGVPVWTLLSDNPDWRWQRERRDTPWYPSMTLFRPSRPGGWAAVLADAAAALAAAVTDRGRLAP